MNLCLFSHYYENNYIPNYVIYYLEKLSEVVDHIILLTNDREIKNIDILDELNISYYKYQNSGYDFGMYHKYLTNNKIDCNKLFLVNDSMVCFNSLNKIKEEVDKDDCDVFGITDSHEIKYHLQSYFLVLSKRATDLFINYLIENGIKNDFTEVIHTYEIGFSQEVLGFGYILRSMFDSKKYSKAHMTNIAVYFADILIRKNLPLIKRKVFFNNFKGAEKDWLKKVRYGFNTHFTLVDKHREENLNINYLYEN